jgi:hypothetical protein
MTLQRSQFPVLLQNSPDDRVMREHFGRADVQQKEVTRAGLLSKWSFNTVIMVVPAAKHKAVW